MEDPMLNQRELFEFNHAGRRLGMAVRGAKGGVST
jgi:hypothetical protein